MGTFINTLWVFSVFSFLGWTGQFIIRTIKKRKLVNPGFINLPFSPSYGLGAVLIFLLFYKIQNLFMIFFGSAILLTVAKFMSSLLFEKIFGFKWEDYSKKKLNLNGYVSVFDAFLYGVLSVILIMFAFKPLETLAADMPEWLSLLIPAIITGLIVADFIITIITVIHLRRHLKQMKNISELLNDNTRDISDDELRAKYEKRLIKNKIFRARLVNAFPDMQSVNYEKQFAEMKAKLEIIKERNEDEYEKKPDDALDKPFAYGLNFSKLFWLYFIGCFFGTILETIWAYITLGHFEVRVGLVWGPFIPVYGGGAVAITLCLYRLHKANDLIIYLASGVIGATFEYFCSYFQELFLGTVSWDYSNTPFNINGRTNLMFALIWGLLGLFWLRYIYPVFSRVIEKIPKRIGKVVTIALVIFMIIDSVLSIAAVYRMTQRENGVKPGNAVMEWVDNTFNDDYLNTIFPNMAKSEEWSD